MPENKQLGSAYQLFLDQGVVGAVALLAIAALIWVTRALLKAKDDRVADQAAFSTVLQASNENTRALAVETAKVAADVAKHNEITRLAVNALEKAVEGMEETLDRVKEESYKVRTSVEILAKTQEKALNASNTKKVG